MPVLISYDIESDKVRLKLANKLIAAGFTRVQLSVFIGDPKERVLRQLTSWMKQHVPRGTGCFDKVLILDLSWNQMQAARFVGPVPEEWQWIVDPPDAWVL